MVRSTSSMPVIGVVAAGAAHVVPQARVVGDALVAQRLGVGTIAEQHVERLDVERRAALHEHGHERLPRRHRQRDALLVARRERLPVDDEALDAGHVGRRRGGEAALVVGAVHVDVEALRLERLGEHRVRAAVLGAGRRAPRSTRRAPRRSGPPRSRARRAARARPPSPGAPRWSARSSVARRVAPAVSERRVRFRERRTTRAVGERTRVSGEQLRVVLARVAVAEPVVRRRRGRGRGARPTRSTRSPRPCRPSRTSVLASVSSACGVDSSASAWTSSSQRARPTRGAFAAPARGPCARQIARARASRAPPAEIAVAAASARVNSDSARALSSRSNASCPAARSSGTAARVRVRGEARAGQRVDLGRGVACHGPAQPHGARARIVAAAEPRHETPGGREVLCIERGDGTRHVVPGRRGTGPLGRTCGVLRGDGRKEARVGERDCGRSRDARRGDA